MSQGGERTFLELQMVSNNIEHGLHASRCAKHFYFILGNCHNNAMSWVLLLLLYLYSEETETWGGKTACSALRSW